MPWITRGLRDGIVTSRYPKRADDYGPDHRSSVKVTEPLVTEGDEQALSSLCPTGAIVVTQGTLQVDRGRCILCGRCIAERPERFSYDGDPALARSHRQSLVVPEVDPDVGAIEATRLELFRRVRALRRSVHIRHVDAGSDGSEEWEVAALLNPVYDVHRLGIFFTASPRHADLLLVTGSGTAGMTGPLRRTYEAMPSPKVVIAVGTDAVSGGLVAGCYATGSGVAGTLEVDVFVPGSPPSPFSILHGILLATGRLEERQHTR